MKYVKSCISAMTALLVSGSVASAEEPLARRQESVVSITGEGTARVVPDEAVVFAGVASAAATAHEAMAVNTNLMTAVIAAARSAGIADSDIQTSNLSLQPQYSDKSVRNGAARITGYQVINRLSIRARRLDHLGELIDALVGAGANQIYGLNFEVSEIQKYADVARKAAVAEIRRKAQVYAEAAGVKLGRLISLAEGPPQSPRPLMRAAASGGVPVESGEVDVKAQASAVFEVLEN
jgi:uncharacterized protein